MKSISVVTLLLGIIAVLSALAVMTGRFDGTGPLEARIDSLKTERSAVRKQAADVRLRIQGWQKSLSDIPDSTRLAQSGLLMKSYRSMQKKSAILSHRETDQTRLIASARRQIKARRLDRRRLVRPLTAAGAFLLLLGSVLRRRALRAPSWS